MILTASDRIHAPRDFVFARATEFDRLARAAAGRGAEVAAPEHDGAQVRYALRYPFRDELWPVVLMLEGATPPEGLQIALEARVATAQGAVRFSELSAEVTQVDLRAELRPVNMQGRLLIGSLHMLRARVQARLDRDLAALARGAEALWAEARA
ncbi:hypothetical protein [Rhodobaculum claviforme]|uniref:Polyketide cyclase / dehydrase and lipid transport n=1 Tax=Rhodobaculum claviforme TaxID=1549854 RepID=A0A934TK97_9RHOB|nr:hypothetical protein [Rhodobaculum claviforme]MBK5927081.1 hypothetical protein [Rhodobaculum claviforme]